jgi:hypothetical protein
MLLLLLRLRFSSLRHSNILDLCVPYPVLTILFSLFDFLASKDFHYIGLSNILDLSVPDECYYVPDECYYVSDECYYVPDEGYSRNMSWALNLIFTRFDV